MISMKWIISSGRGPAECELAVVEVSKLLMDEAQKNRISCHKIAEQGLKKDKQCHIAQSLNFELCGEEAHLIQFSKHWLGTIKVVFESPFRPQHRRKNWFVHIAPIASPKEIKIDETEIEFQAISGTGAGGQHVNKNKNCVRAIHPPTGITVVCRDERSLVQNRKNAINLIRSEIEKCNQLHNIQVSADNWQNHNTLERGNEIRTIKLKF